MKILSPWSGDGANKNFRPISTIMPNMNEIHQRVFKIWGLINFNAKTLNPVTERRTNKWTYGQTEKRKLYTPTYFVCRGYNQIVWSRLLIQIYIYIYTCNFHPIRLFGLDCWYKSIYYMTNSADPDQLASNWSWSTLFAKGRAYLGSVGLGLILRKKYMYLHHKWAWSGRRYSSIQGGTSRIELTAENLKME